MICCDLTSNSPKDAVSAMQLKNNKLSEQITIVENKYKKLKAQYNLVQTAYDAEKANKSISIDKANKSTSIKACENSEQCIHEAEVKNLMVKVENLEKLNYEIADKNSVLKDLNNELKASNQLLREKTSDQVFNLESANQRSYASAVKDNHVKLTKNIPKIIVEPSTTQNAEELTCEIKKLLVDKKNINFKKLLTTKQNKIIISTTNTVNVDEFKEMLSSVTADAKIEQEEINKPRLKIVGAELFDKLESNTDIISDIRERNTFQESDQIDIVHKYLNDKNKKWTMIVEVNSGAYLRIMKNKKIFVGCCNCTVYDDYNVNICYKCNRYGHSSKKCTNNECCRYCAGEHASKDCQQKENLQCINCTTSNEKYKTNRRTDHAADDKTKCDTYKYKVQQVIKRSDYPYNPT